MVSGKGVVIKVFGLYYAVKSGNDIVNCFLRGKIRQRGDLHKYSDPIAVGDDVLFEIQDDGAGVIEEILPRKNVFSRKEKGRNKREDIIACNLDQIIVVQSFASPKLNLRFVDRLYVRGCKGDIPIVVCINKIDIADDEIIRYIKEYYKNARIRISMVSALTGEGIDEFRKIIEKRVSLFVGNSGVGKTSLLNYMYPHLQLRVAEISRSTGKGRHTTTNVEMIMSEKKTCIIDTPGLREFGLMDIEPAAVGNYFYEFGKLGALCSFQPCTHDHEPHCEIKRRVDAGRIHEDRYVSYLNMLYSIRDYHENLYA